MTGTEGPPHREMAAGLIPAVAELLRSLNLSQHWLERPAQSAFWLHQCFLSPSFLIFFPLPFSSVSQAKVCRGHSSLCVKICLKLTTSRLTSTHRVTRRLFKIIQSPFFSPLFLYPLFTCCTSSPRPTLLFIESSDLRTTINIYLRRLV